MRWTDLLSAANIAAYYRESNSATAFPGEALFPAKKKMGLDLKYLESIGNGVRVLKRAAFDTLPPKRERHGFNMKEYEMPFFREQMNIKERDRQELLKISETNNAMINEVVREIYDDRIELINGASASMERMRMQALFTGEININDSEGLDVIVDYGFNAANQETTLAGTARWTDYANAKPIQDLLAAKKVAKITGTAVANMSQKTFADLLSCESVGKSIYVNFTNDTLLGENVVKDWIRTQIGVNIVVLDALVDNYWYIDETGIEIPFIPDNVVSIVQSGIQGNTWYGTTPEEADLLNGQTDAKVEIVNTGVAITSLTVAGPPVQVMTTASMIGLPVMSSVKRMHIIKTA